jgi:chromosome segregation ATPase
MRSSLLGQLGSLDRAKKSYEKASREAERALDEYQRADADLNLSRAVVEKARLNMVVKTQQCEDAKTEYASQLSKTNDLQVRPQQISETIEEAGELHLSPLKTLQNYALMCT